MATIGIDYAPAVQHAPGAGRYVRELVRALVRLPDGPRLALLEGGLGKRAVAESALGLAGTACEARARVRRRRVPIPRRALDLAARVGLGADRLLGGCALFHRVHPSHPRTSRAPFTLAITELPAPGTSRDAELAAAARRAAGVFVFSSAARASVASRYEVAGERIVQSPVGSEHWERDAGNAPLARREPPECIVLGALRAARQPLRVLAAFEALSAAGVDARLVFAGRAGDAAGAFTAALEASPARARVRWIRDPAESAMPALVGGATTLVHLADDEQTAVTLLEACRAGLTVVASDLPAFRESVRNAAEWVAPDAPAGELAERLAAALARGASAPERLLQRRVAAPFTWESAAEVHARAWRRILSAC